MAKRKSRIQIGAVVTMKGKKYKISAGTAKGKKYKAKDMTFRDNDKKV